MTTYSDLMLIVSIFGGFSVVMLVVILRNIIQLKNSINALDARFERTLTNLRVDNNTIQSRVVKT